jgi:hypothetical protein
MSSAISKIEFVTSLLRKVIGESPPSPRILSVDTIGAIFMAKNVHVGQRTKHSAM